MKSNDKSSLKTLSINHLMKDLIENSVKDCSDNNLLTLLIVDNFSSKILSSFLKMSDLLGKGISSIELINNKRNKNNNYGAIYFLSPSNESCNLLIEDFNDLDKPTYNRIYIFFTHKLSEDLLEKITTEGIFQHTILIKEFNLSFILFDENIFDLGWESGLKIFNCTLENELKLINSMADKIFTVCSILNIHPHIQYQKSSKLCEKLSYKLEYIFNNNNIMNNKKMEGIILLTDRSLDLISPFLHDYNYQALCYDLFDIKNKSIEINGKIIKLSNEDEFWNNYKYRHIAEVLEDLIKNFYNYKNNELNKEKNILSFSEMANCLEDNPKYIYRISQLINQLNLAQKIIEKYKNNNIFELIELEQDIFSSKINNNEILSKFLEIKSKLDIKFENYIRLMLILYLNNENNRFNEILKDDFFKENNDIINNLKYIINNIIDYKINYNKFGKKLLINNENISKIINYHEIRTMPSLSNLVYKVCNNLLEEEEFPFINNKKVEIKNNLNEKILIIFNIGGLSYNEIASIENLENVNDYKIYLGTTCIMNASEYISHLKNIDKNCEQSIKKDCLEDLMTQADENACIINVNLHNTNNINITDDNIPLEKQKLLDDNDFMI